MSSSAKKSGAKQPTWDEFHALRNRQRSSETPASTSEAAPAAASSAAKSGSSTPVTQNSNSRMAFAVSPAAKAIMLAVVTADFLGALARLATAASPLVNMAPSNLMWIATATWQLLWAICLVLTVLELLALLIRSPLAHISNTMYMTDLILLAVEGHYGYVMGRADGHIVVLVRVIIRAADLARVIMRINAAERAKLQDKLEHSTKQKDALQARLEQATGKWQRESETRSRVEVLMTRYKAEVDTLREALSIAAQEQVLRQELGVTGGEEDEYYDDTELTADELAALDASQGPKFIVSSDGSYTKLQAPSAINMAAEALRMYAEVEGEGAGEGSADGAGHSHDDHDPDHHH